MPGDIFISHASEDASIAAEVCGLLEGRGLRCWIAPRDVAAGAAWDEAILDAIERSRVFLLILSHNSNQSQFVKNEVNRAFSQKKAIVTFRLEDVVPGRSLELYLARHHWTDAFPPPLGTRVEHIAGSITALLNSTLPAGAGEAAAAAGVTVPVTTAASGAAGPIASPGSAATLPVADATPQPWWRSKAVMAVAAVVVAAVLAGGGWFYRSRMSGGETIDSVAVLPFVNGSGDPNMEYLSDGITESLINSLSQLPNLKVMSRDSAFHYKGKDTDAKTVGRELGVRAIFKGRVTQLGDSLAISAELIDARNNDHIWGQQYSRRVSDIFALQGDIAKEITTALRTRLSGEDEKHLTNSYTANPEAYQDYLRGRFWLNKKTGEGINKSIEYFQKAIEKDPTYTLAYSGLSYSYSLLGGLGYAPPDETYPKAREAAIKALGIDDTLGEAHSSLAYIKATYDWDWSGAEKEFQRAIQLTPGSATAHDQYGTVLVRMGRVQEGIAEIKQALELDPLSSPYNRDLGDAFYFARQYDQAIEQLRKTLELDPSYVQPQNELILAHAQKSMYKEAIAEGEKRLVADPDDRIGLGYLGIAYAKAARRPEAQKVLDQLNDLSKRQYVPAVRSARIYAGLREKDKAFEWLEKGYDGRELGVGLGSIKVDPIYDPLRSDPRFVDLLRRMNLQP